MIKILKRKFIITAMISISILLIVLLGAINIINYYITQGQTDSMLTMLSDNEGKIPPQITPQDRKAPVFFAPPINEDIAMSMRYFTVRIDNDGKIIQTNINNISSVTVEQAKQLAQRVYNNTESTGKIDNFKYKISASPDTRGNIIVFLDTTSQIYSVLVILAISICIGIICWILMLLLVILLSKKAILPIALNMEKQKQFVTNAGHEIKTPLAIILANTDAMELHNGENKWSRNIREQTLRLNGLMQNLLILAKMDESEIKLPLTDFSISLILNESLNQFAESILLNNINLETYIQDNIILHANRDSINELINILIDNAVKYTDEGGNIYVTLEKMDKTIILNIKNTCNNLPQGNPEKLFDRFYRADSARTQKNGGYGIGLSVAKTIVKANKGSIYVKYESNNIISFIVKF